MKKKILALALVFCLALALGIGGTLAYLTDTGTVTNTFTVGNVKITLDEAKVNANGVALKKDENNTEVTLGENQDLSNAIRVDSNTYKLMPGHSYIKDPTITVSSGSEDCWLVATVTINHLSDLEKIYENDTTGVKQTWGLSLAGNGKLVSGGVSDYMATAATDNSQSGTMLEGNDGKEVAFITYAEDKTADTITYTYWFKQAHAANAKEVLFEKLNIPQFLTNEQLHSLNYKTITTGEGDNAETSETESAFKITVKAYAIQKDGFSDVYAAWKDAFAESTTTD